MDAYQSIKKFCQTCNKSVSRYDRHVKTAYHLKRLDGKFIQPQKTSEGKFWCESCRIEVLRYDRHIKSTYHQKRLNDNFVHKDNKGKYFCQTCNKSVLRYDRHIKSTYHLIRIDPFFNHPNNDGKFNCKICSKDVRNMKAHFKSKKHIDRCCTYVSCETSIKGSLKKYSYRDISTIDPKLFLTSMKEEIRKRCLEQNWNNFKLGIALDIEFYKESPDGVRKTLDSWFNGGCMFPVSDMSLLDGELTKRIKAIERCIESFEKEGSGWIINRLLAFQIKIAKYKPLKGSSYITLPEKYRNPKFRLINMKNDDQECFKWCVGRSDCMDQKPKERISQKVRESANKFNWDGIKFPVSLNQISKFEKQNKDISVSVYGLDKVDGLYPLRVSKERRDKSVMMLMIEQEGNSHYVLMQDLSPFINQTHKRKTYPCRYCLHSFYRKELLDKHEPLCSIHTPVRMELAEGPVQFKHHHNQIKHPFTIYADFESTLLKVHGAQSIPTKSYTLNTEKHIPNSFCVFTKCEVDKYSKLEIYNGDDAPAKFVEYMKEEIVRIYELLDVNIPYNLTAEEKIMHRNADTCYICDEPFTQDNYKVRDHNHLTGAYRGPAHNVCNLKISKPNYIPVLMHNFSNYDAHLFIKEFGKVEGDLTVIPQTDEKYISMTQKVKVGDVWREIRFIDSFRFMPSSLDKLSTNLNTNQLINLAMYFKDEQQFDLLSRKGVYPYQWLDNETKFSEQQLPPKSEFYSSLKGEGITDSDYQHAQNVWKTFNCRTFRDYHNIYLKTDTILLADVFENFRNICLQTYSLDPVHYYTAPGLSWSALLKYSKIKLDLIQDPDMLLMIERGIRGGVSTITHRHAQANNPYLPETYDKSKPTNYIPYLDANNLYGWAMSQPLPTGGFKWISEEDFDVREVSDESSKGYILEVDLMYPEKLHDLHNDYPLAPESLELSRVKKLVPNLQNKSKYIIHYRALKQCLELGLKLTMTHRVLEFNQSPWMKGYIDLNTNLRKKAVSDFDKDFFKLMNNSVFGKTMENIRKHIDVKLVKSKERSQKLINKPNFSSFKIFTDDLVAVHMKRTKLKFDKPVYVGQAILDLSKTLMYNFHYNVIKKTYKDKASLLFTDTDSLCYNIETNDFYNDMEKMGDLFDTSNYPVNHSVYSNLNKKVLGKFKDETAGVPIKEFVGLRAKLYSYKVGEQEEKKAKGIAKNVVKKEIQMDDYRRVLLEGSIIYRSMQTFGTNKHQIYTKKVNKVALSGSDDKRVIQKDGITTLAYGHYKLT